MRMNKLIKRIGIMTLNLALAFNGISFSTNFTNPVIEASSADKTQLMILISDSH
jgi:hypothetical protein